MSKPVKRRPVLAAKPNRATQIKLELFAHLYQGGAETEELRNKLTGNQTACYMHLHPKAGYKTAEVKACDYMNHPIVQAILEQRAQRASERADITVEYILNNTQEVVERCMQIRPVMDRTGKQVVVEDRDGELCNAYTFDAANSLRGLELLGKHKKMWTDKVEANVNGGQSLNDLLKQARDESE